MIGSAEVVRNGKQRDREPVIEIGTADAFEVVGLCAGQVLQVQARSFEPQSAAEYKKIEDVHSAARQLGRVVQGVVAEFHRLFVLPQVEDPSGCVQRMSRSGDTPPGSRPLST